MAARRQFFQAVAVFEGVGYAETVTRCVKNTNLFLFHGHL